MLHDRVVLMGVDADVCAPPVETEKEPIISLEKLTENIPEFDWSRGHSGVLLPDEIADKLIDLLDKE